MHAVIALGEDRAGTQAFYESLKTSMAVTDSEMMSTNSTELCEPNAPISLNRLMPKDAKTRQLRKIDNCGGRENASKKRLRVHFALQLCGVKDATNCNCRRFYIVVSIF